MSNGLGTAVQQAILALGACARTSSGFCCRPHKPADMVKVFMLTRKNCLGRTSCLTAMLGGHDGRPPNGTSGRGYRRASGVDVLLPFA